MRESSLWSYYQFHTPTLINIVCLHALICSSLPNVAIFATGGTIAGSSSSNTDTTGYTAGVVGIAALIQGVPELLTVANIQGAQVSLGWGVVIVSFPANSVSQTPHAQIINTASESLNSTVVLRIAKFANEVLCAEGSTTDGLVITHGTDTIEETAMLRESTNV
jgi:L-asparaginase